ncbi:MAG: septal ring lytic transglycosylase RlpA family protein, partial [Thiohalocapsa sp.]
SGQIYDKNQLSAAHKTLPLGSRVRVTDKRTGKSVVVRVNDRGPFVKGRIIDLSRRAATELGIIRRGVTPVKVEVLSVAGRRGA